MASPGGWALEWGPGVPPRLCPLGGLLGQPPIPWVPSPGPPELSWVAGQAPPCALTLCLPLQGKGLPGPPVSTAPLVASTQALSSQSISIPRTSLGWGVPHPWQGWNFAGMSHTQGPCPFRRSLLAWETPPQDHVASWVQTPSLSLLHSPGRGRSERPPRWHRPSWSPGEWPPRP